MRHLLATSVSLFSLTLLGPVACGGTVTQEEPQALGTHSQALNAVGQGCSSDAQCATGLCWTVADSYPTYNPAWINADSCTEECGGPTDTYCKQLAAEFNAPYPNQARCIPARGVYDNNPYDHSVYVCDLLPAGLGKVHWVE